MGEFINSVIKLETLGTFDILVTSKTFKKREDAKKFMEDDFKKEIDNLKMCETTHILDINEYENLGEKNLKYYKGNSQDNYNTYKTRWFITTTELK